MHQKVIIAKEDFLTYFVQNIDPDILCAYFPEISTTPKENLPGLLLQELEQLRDDDQFSIYDKAPYGVSIIDVYTNIICYCNPAYAQINQRENPEEIIGHSVDTMNVYHENQEAHYAFTKEIEKRKMEIKVIPHILENGTAKPFLVIMYYYKNRQGHPFVVSLDFDLSDAQITGTENILLKETITTLTATTCELEQLRQSFSFLLYNDQLTGLLNRTALLEDLEKMIRQVRAGISHAILMLDLNHLKSINDDYGHRHGDKAIIETARRLQSIFESLRVPGASLYHYHGDEFIIIFPFEAQNLKTIKTTLSQHIQNAFEEPLHLKDKEIVLGISCGQIVLPDNLTEVVAPQQNIKELIDKILDAIDERMYDDKRNRHRQDKRSPEI